MECTGCSLCLEIITNNNFVMLEDFHKNMLQILIPNINWSNVIYGQPKMCHKCSEDLQITYLFKNSCFIDNKKVEEPKMNGETQAVTSQIYCFCCQRTIFRDLADSEKALLNGMVHRCFPQLPSASLDNLGSCENCLSSLNHLDSFINTCLKTEEDIKNYCSTMGLDRNDFDLDKYIKAKHYFTVSAESGRKIEEVVFKSTSRKPETTVLDNNSENVEEPNETTLLEKKADVQDVKNVKETAVGQVKPADSCSDQKNNLEDKASQFSGKFRCDKCDYSAKYKSSLVSHMVRHKDPSKTKMHRCDICGHETKRIADLRWHMIIHKDPEELKLYYCADCSYKTKRKADLKQHVITHMTHTFKCAFCSFETKNKVYLDTIHTLLHKDKSEVRTFKCDSCPYESIIKYHMKLHSKVHKDPSELEKYKCNWCDFETTYKQGIRIHQLRHKCKSELQMYKCNSCDYEGTQKALLKDHIMSRHTIHSVTYDCSKCSYKAKQKGYLRKHMDIHKDPSEIRMYKCDMCTYQGRRKGSLKSHMYSHIKSLQALENKQEEIKEILSKIRNMSKM